MNLMDRNLLALRRRLNHCIEKCKTNAAKQWHSSKLKEMTGDQIFGSDAGHKENKKLQHDSAHENDVQMKENAEQSREGTKTNDKVEGWTVIGGTKRQELEKDVEQQGTVD